MQLTSTVIFFFYYLSFCRAWKGNLGSQHYKIEGPKPFRGPTLLFSYITLRCRGGGGKRRGICVPYHLLSSFVPANGFIIKWHCIYFLYLHKISQLHYCIINALSHLHAKLLILSATIFPSQIVTCLDCGMPSVSEVVGAAEGGWNTGVLRPRVTWSSWLDHTPTWIGSTQRNYSGLHCLM